MGVNIHEGLAPYVALQSIYMVKTFVDFVLPICIS